MLLVLSASRLGKKVRIPLAMLSRNTLWARIPYSNRANPLCPMIYVAMRRNAVTPEEKRLEKNSESARSVMSLRAMARILRKKIPESGT